MPIGNRGLIVHSSPEAAKAYYKMYYQKKMKRQVRAYGKRGNYRKEDLRLVTKNSIVFFFGEGHEGLGLRERNEGCLIG